MVSGYEQNYKLLVSNLADCDFLEASGRLGLQAPVDGVLTIPYMGREYAVKKDGVFPLDNQPSDPNDRSILIHYVTSNGAGEPEGAYYLPYHFAGSVLPNSQSFLPTRAIREGAQDFCSIQKAMGFLGARYQGELRSGEYFWHYSILPKMPIEVIYMEADEEFPCEIKIKFDGSAGRYMGFETLAFMCGSFVHGLLRIHRQV